MRHAHSLRQRLLRAIARICARLGLTRSGSAQSRNGDHEAEEWLGIG